MGVQRGAPKSQKAPHARSRPRSSLARMLAARPRAPCARRSVCTRAGAVERHAPHAPHALLPPAAASRRALLHGGAATAAALLLCPGRALSLEAAVSTAADAAEAEAPSALEPLFSAAELYWPGPSLAYQRQLYYPSWLFGEWRVTSTLKAFTTPRGERFVPGRAAEAAAEDLNKPVTFAARFYSTLPDTRENGLRVALGLLPRDAIIADRAFNTESLTNASIAAAPGTPPDAPPAVRAVEYDPRESPDALRVTYTGGRRAELFLSGMRTDPVPEDGAYAPPVFRTAECSRQTTVGARSVDVRDYQILSRFERLSPSRVRMRQRVGIYLTAQAPLYFEAINVAVAIYDYDLEMERVQTPSGQEGAPPLTCVPTPKDVTQCL